MELISLLASLPFKIIAFLKYQIVIKGIFFRSRVSLDKGNDIQISGEILSSSIICKGRGNQVQLRNKLLHSEIRIEGNNNLLVFEEGGFVSHSNILIRANNARVEVGAKSDLLSVCVVCQGEGNYIEIGDDCLFSRDIDIWNSDTHTILDADGNIINPSAPVKIGNHVWIGKHVRILKNVEIGENVVVGMDSLVSNSIPANSIAVGSPAKVIKTNTNWSKDLHQLTTNV